MIDIEEKLKISVCFVFYFEEKLKIGVCPVIFDSKQCVKIRCSVSDIVFWCLKIFFEAQNMKKPCQKSIFMGFVDHGKTQQYSIRH